MPACGWQQHRKRVLSIVHDAGRKAYKRHSTGHVVGFRDCMLCGDWLSSNARMHVKSSSSVRAMSCGETVCLTKGKILLKSTLSRVASHTSMPSSGPKIKKSPCVTDYLQGTTPALISCSAPPLPAFTSDQWVHNSPSSAALTSGLGPLCGHVPPSFGTSKGRLFPAGTKMETDPETPSAALSRRYCTVQS